ncbi:uncharacterized protein Z518_01105 [Rhinocladiella mackenziei CBS 650.93]|uniref:MARVEL domain-containing protein n=1 Tax=Rhinocladiella mackenziei CBS 650.93 TaxID=1442369 RepID=A0A0D2IVH1_9EURO|nr:uncharacterized protein Z518_01105 [Rhinocladiella mackenziei CBS 650.93]KIX10024.1 hypothetical protein Z518_01105 [Rhinocladiella mackenziei CBS 650.93]
MSSLPHGLSTTIQILQLVVGFCAVILAAFCAVCFGAQCAYCFVWWSFPCTLIICILRWWSEDFYESRKEQVVHLAFELLSLISWLATTGVLIALNIRLHNLSETYAYDVANGIQLTAELMQFQFTDLGLAGLYCSYVLNAVSGILW